MAAKRSRGARGRGRNPAPISMRVQAEKWVAARASRGRSKSSGAELRSDRTVNHYVGNLGRAAEAIRQLHGIHKLRDITRIQAQAYLDQRASEGISTKTIQAYAKALQTLPKIEKLDIPNHSEALKPVNSRAYTPQQIRAVQSVLSSRAALASRILHQSGCRVQDLATIRLSEERPLANARLKQLHPDRYSGREGWVRVTYIGKGGHHYESTISQPTAEELEQVRLASPRLFTDRGKLAEHPVHQHYDLLAGKNLSDAWRAASNRALGWNAGAHGLRHTFAQERVESLQRAGFTWSRALQRTSEQMGHYRHEEIYTYLR